MKIYISNFLRNLARYFRESRAKWIKFLLIVAAAIIAFLLIRAGVERWQKARYEKRVQALEGQIREADARAKDAEERAATIQTAIEAKYVELRDLKGRAEIAEANLRNARRSVAPLKEAYEQTRLTPMPADDAPCADACAELSRLGYPCK